MTEMTNSKLEELSIVYWLKNLLASFPTITVVKGYPKTILNPPIISVDWNNLTGDFVELGNRQVLKERTWYFGIFALSEDQREDIGYFLFDNMEDPIKVYDYNQGLPPVVVPDINYLVPLRKTVTKIEIPDNISDTEEKQIFRSVVTLVTVNGKI